MINDIDEASVTAENNNYVRDNQVYGLVNKTEAIKCLSRNNSILLKKHCQYYKPIRATKQQRNYRTFSGTK